jgi:hypothetical protein
MERAWIRCSQGHPNLQLEADEIMADRDVRIDHYGQHESLSLRNHILKVYLASHHDQQHDPWFGPDLFWQRLVELYAPSREFGLVAAWLVLQQRLVIPVSAGVVGFSGAGLAVASPV